jgi:DNA adenine methylase
VLLNRVPSPVETYNALDGEVVNFFRVLRDHKAELVEKIGLTPFSREEFGLACEVDVSVGVVERARRFYVRARQVRTGLAQTASLGRWANCKKMPIKGEVGQWPQQYSYGDPKVAPLQRLIRIAHLVELTVEICL